MGASAVQWTMDFPERMNVEFKAFGLYVKKLMNGGVETEGLAIAGRWNALEGERREHYLRRALNVPGSVQVGVFGRYGGWHLETLEENV